MQSQRKNIYRIARECAGYTREEAAELLYISTRSLADYETGKTIPPDDVVCRMVEVYRATWLAYEHLRQGTEVGRRYLPEVDLTDLARSVLKLQKEIADVNKINPDIVEVACDGVIDEHEMSKWKIVQREISEMAAAAMAVLFSQKERRALI